MKTVRGKIYCHVSAMHELDERARGIVEAKSRILDRHFRWNIARLDFVARKVTFLFYPNFETDPHPALGASAIVDLTTSQVKYYSQSSNNPPVLHRKETFLCRDNTLYTLFSGLTTQEEKVGLLDKSVLRIIGHKKQWEELVKKSGFIIRGHRLERRMISDGEATSHGYQ